MSLTTVDTVASATYQAYEAQVLRLVAASDPPTRTQLADAAAALVEDLSDNPGCGAAGFDVGSWICFHHYGALLYAIAPQHLRGTRDCLLARAMARDSADEEPQEACA